MTERLLAKLVGSLVKFFEGTEGVCAQPDEEARYTEVPGQIWQGITVTEKKGEVSISVRFWVIVDFEAKAEFRMGSLPEDHTPEDFLLWVGLATMVAKNLHALEERYQILDESN